MRSSIRFVLLAVLLAVPTGWIACSSDRATYDVSEGILGGPEAGVDACPAVACSRDLRSVIDCAGNVIEQCAEDQACGNLKCTDPCAAAAANEGSIGCSFAVPGSNSDQQTIGSCLALFVANNWSSPATLRIEFDGQERSLDGAVWVTSVENGVVKHTRLDGPIPPGRGAVVFLAEQRPLIEHFSYTPCPEEVKPILDFDPVVHETGLGRVSLVSSDVPISVYSMYPYGGSATMIPSATLLLPTTSFGDRYVLLSAWGGKTNRFGRGVLPGANPEQSQSGKPTIQIVAIEDGTSIDIRPKVDIIGGEGVPASARGELATYRLNRGELLQITQENELIGSVMESNKPVGLFGGHTVMNVPSDIRAADQENEQIPPVSAWGHEYAVLPAPKRITLWTEGIDKVRDPSVIRIVGAADGTELVYEPMAPRNAPTRLHAGEFAAFFAEQPFVVRSQDNEHPFFVAVYMTGGDAAQYTESHPIGDPELAIVVPTDQWLDTYGFFTDANYDLSAAFVTRRRERGVFHDVTIDCAGTLEGWKPITPDYEWTHVMLSRFGEPQKYPGGECKDGAHRSHSEGPFAITVWGISPHASYAYPGGTGLRPISKTNLTVR